MAERPDSIAARTASSEATPAQRQSARVVRVRVSAARSKPRQGGVKRRAGKSKRSAGESGQGDKTRRPVRSASASTTHKTSKGTTPRKASKKAPAKAARKGTPKPPGAAKKATPKKAVKKAPAKARKQAGRKHPEKRASAHKAPKVQRKPATPKKATRASAKSARKAPAKKPAKRAPAKKTVKVPARKAAKERPARKAARPKTDFTDRPVSESSLETPAVARTGGLKAPTRAEQRRRAAEAAAPEHEEIPEILPEPELDVALLPGARRPRGDGVPRKRRKAARFDVEQPEVRKKKRARLEKMRRAGVFGVPGARPRRVRKRKPRDEMVRPSPPLEKTDPLKHYLAGEMVPCPVGCGGFSEVVRVSTMENGAGEIWFECLSCAQRKMFEIPAATPTEQKAVFAELEGGHEPLCPRHTKPVSLRRRGRDFVCPECGVRFAEP